MIARIMAALSLGSTLALAQIGNSTAWQQLPPLPDAEGFAGAFAGTSENQLLVAGGANIVGPKWGDPFTKKWYDMIFALAEPQGEWRVVGRLPRALAYGVSFSVKEGLICAGGSDLKGHYAEVFRISLTGGLFTREELPNLPRPCSNACGAVVGRTLYLAGGIETPTATKAMHNFWALDLDAAEPQWRELPPWPGPERMLSVAAAHEDGFYLFSGASLAAGPDGKPLRTYLKDAYRFTATKGWETLAEMPRAAVAAPSPAISTAQGVQLFSGDDGSKSDFQPLEKHPGFPRDVLLYEVKENRWSTQGDVPFSRATVPVAFWQNRYVVPNGEVRPRVRTPEVWSITP